MDLLEVKSRIAEALVESIFRRARYTVEPHRDPMPLRLGREDFSPDFSIHRAPNGRDQHALIEVKYRSSVDQFISVENQRGDRSVFVSARRQWPELCFVFVTDRPQPGRSSFQALSFADHPAEKPFETVDLVALERFRIFPHNIADHEELLRRIYGLLATI
ncbi:MAG: hypothetical protein FJZ38_24960 [Candidatus Rokubacteria bacterium]|nr:hypothetical protein [Candidatus Rokubacteria bacterium]